VKVSHYYDLDNLFFYSTMVETGFHMTQINVGTL